MDRSQQRVLQLVQILRYRDDYWTEVTQMRDKWRLPERGYPRWTDGNEVNYASMDDLVAWAAQWENEGVQDPYMAVYDEIAEVNRRFGLPQELDRIVSDEIIYGETRGFSGIAVEMGHDPVGIPYAVMYISPNMTLQVIQDHWDQVRQAQRWLRQQYQTAILPPQRAKRNLERDLFIWKRVRRDGLTYEDAYDEWLANHADEEEEPVEITAVMHAVSSLEKEYGL